MGNNSLNEMCRLCLYKHDNLLDIFCINENHGYIAAEVIQDLLQMEVGLSDGFPRCVCSFCLDKLTDFKLFKKKCLESRSTFQQEFNAGNQQATWRKLQDTQVEQDPLAFFSPIKVETPGCESMEVPVEVEIAIKAEVDEAFSRPIKVEPSDSEMIEDPVEVEIAVEDEVDEQNCRQLRKAWDIIKMRRKRVLAEEARRRMGTGRGPCPSTSKDSTIPELEAAIPSIDHYLLSIVDSDRLMEAPSGPEDFVVIDGDLGGEDAAGSWSESQQLEETPIVEAVGSTAVVSGSASEPRQAVDTLQFPMGPGPSPQQPTDCVGGTRNTTAPRALTRAEAHRRELDARLARIQAASADEAKMRQAAAEDEALLRQIRIQAALEQLEHQRILHAMEVEYKRHTYNEEEIVRAGENQAASHGSTTESMAMTLSEKLTSSPSASMDRFCASTKLEQEVEDGSGNAVHFHSLDSATTLSTTCFSIPSCVPVPAASISHPLGGRNAIGMDNSVMVQNSGESTSHHQHTIVNNLLSQKSQECDLMEGKLGTQSNVMGMVNEISKGLDSSVTVKNSGESTTHHRPTIVNNLLSQKSQECDLMEGKLGTQSNVMGMVNEISKGLDSSVTVNNSGESTTHHRPTIVNNLLSQKSQKCDLMEGKLGTQSNVMGMVIEISQGLDSKGEQVPRKEVERRRKSRSGGLEEEKNNGSRKRRSCAAGGSTPRACTVCSKSFKTSGALRKHAQTHSGERCFLCSVCGKSFLWNCDLALHMRRHAGERPHSCVACSKSFAAVSDLNVHLRTHNGDRPYACSVCSKSFTRKGVLDDHMLTHTGERPYSCRLCSKAFRRRSHLTIHFRTHTGEKPYSCGVCSKSFNESCSLKVHSRVHSKEKPYTCNVCYRSFSQSGSLNTHMRTHSAEKPYSCGACSKSFAKSDELSAHMRVHSEGRPHACGVCSESFSVINQLQLHMSEHEGETRYSCRMCFKSFPSCKSLNMHMLIHEPGNVYKCDHCSHAYSDKSALRKHILKCHVQDKS